MDLNRERPFWGGAGLHVEKTAEEVSSRKYGKFFLGVAYIRMDISSCIITNDSFCAFGLRRGKLGGDDRTRVSGRRGGRSKVMEQRSNICEPDC